jgi:hypothetical protein
VLPIDAVNVGLWMSGILRPSTTPRLYMEHRSVGHHGVCRERMARGGDEALVLSLWDRIRSMQSFPLRVEGSGVGDRQGSKVVCEIRE